MKPYQDKIRPFTIQAQLEPEIELSKETVMLLNGYVFEMCSKLERFGYVRVETYIGLERAENT